MLLPNRVKDIVKSARPKRKSDATSVMQEAYPTKTLGPCPAATRSSSPSRKSDEHIPFVLGAILIDIHFPARVENLVTRLLPQPNRTQDAGTQRLARVLESFGL